MTPFGQTFRCAIRSRLGPTLRQAVERRFEGLGIGSAEALVQDHEPCALGGGREAM